MATASSTYPSWLAREERLVGREPAGLQAQVAGAPAELTDVSALGCRVRTQGPGGVGAFLTLDVGTLSVAGWVAWRRGEVLGLDFARPLEADQLAALTGRSG